jgi:enamine deaminase RidA (YjgF/YER057c/UK114 family)
MSSSKTAVLTSKAPKPLAGIYSQAIIANGFIYCSGAIAMDATTGKLINGDIKAHTVSFPPLLFDLHLFFFQSNSQN